MGTSALRQQIDQNIQEKIGQATQAMGKQLQEGYRALARSNCKHCYGGRGFESYSNAAMGLPNPCRCVLKNIKGLQEFHQLLRNQSFEQFKQAIDPVEQLVLLVVWRNLLGEHLEEIQKLLNITDQNVVKILYERIVAPPVTVSDQSLENNNESITAG